MLTSRVLCLCMLVLLPAVVRGDESVAAAVNGVGITIQEVEREMNEMARRSSYHRAVTPEQREEYRERALQNLIDRELQFQYARQQGLVPQKSQVNAQMKEVRKRYRSKKDYRAALKAAGITEDELRNRIKKQILIAMAIDMAVTQPSHYTDEALRAYYDANRDEFISPEGIRLRLITLASEDAAQRALEEIQKGSDFEEVATRLSEDAYRSKGGEVGVVQRGRLVPDIEEMAFSLQPGTVAGPLSVGEKWHLLMVEERLPQTQMSFEHVRDDLKRKLEDRKEKELLEQWTDGLRKEAAITITSQGDGKE